MATVGLLHFPSLSPSDICNFDEGYGEIHAVNTREMIFVMMYVSLDMILGAYLLGNMTALIVKGSKTERFRDKMEELIKYMNRNKLGKNISKEIKGHVRLQYESSYTDTAAIQDLPLALRARVYYIVPHFLHNCKIISYCVFLRFADIEQIIRAFS